MDNVSPESLLADPNFLQPSFLGRWQLVTCIIYWMVDFGFSACVSLLRQVGVLPGSNWIRGCGQYLYSQLLQNLKRLTWEKNSARDACNPSTREIHP